MSRKSGTSPSIRNESPPSEGGLFPGYSSAALLSILDSSLVKFGNNILNVRIISALLKLFPHLVEVLFGLEGGVVFPFHREVLLLALPAAEVDVFLVEGGVADGALEICAGRAVVALFNGLDYERHIVVEVLSAADCGCSAEFRFARCGSSQRADTQRCFGALPQTKIWHTIYNSRTLVALSAAKL